MRKPFLVWLLVVYCLIYWVQQHDVADSLMIKLPNNNNNKAHRYYQLFDINAGIQSLSPSRRRQRRLIDCWAAADVESTITSTISSSSVESDSTISHHDIVATSSSLSSAAFDVLAKQLCVTLIASDIKRDNGTDGAATGWTAWMDETNSVILQQQYLDKIFYNYSSETTINNNNVIFWTQWIKTIPKSMILDISHLLRQAVNHFQTIIFRRITQKNNDYKYRNYIINVGKHIDYVECIKMQKLIYNIH